MEYEGQGSPMRGVNTSTDTESTDDATNGAPNSSIIGKVRSRVSSILPNRLAEWFSPSAKTTNDSRNGNLSGAGIARRRRRIEVDDDDDDEDEEEADEEEDGDEEDLEGNNIVNDDDDDEEREQQDGNGDEENVRRRSQDNDHSEEYDEEASYNSQERTARVRLGVRRHLRATNVAVVRQPPAKRLRTQREITSTHDSPGMPRQPLVASTPAVSSVINKYNNNIFGQRNIDSASRYKHPNLCGGIHEREEAPFNFLRSPAANEAPEIDLTEMRLPMQAAVNSSRRNLNIPCGVEDREIGGSSSRGLGLRRQPIGSMCSELLHSDVSPRRMPAAILDLTAGDEDDVNQDGDANDEDDELSANNNNNYSNADMLSKTQNSAMIYNGGVAATKRARLANGTSWDAVANVRDSASDSSDCVADSMLMGGGAGDEVTSAGQSGMHSAANRRTGLFNMSSGATNASSRNGSRTSSFGNGLNFYAYLEGRKSLFSGGGHQSANGATIGAGGGALNNSTLSLTSLNRRQFNASLYGSTSALSDSRLLNTFSPFYKGKTMYGGAAAYASRGAGPAGGTGAGASGGVRITPTLIRPTSSLSTLSSSSNSLAALGPTPAVENTSGISSTAKRILDLINDFATPLSEAKKMANNLKANHQQLPQMRSRLNEADVQAARAVRLSQVRTPYTRPVVVLQSTAKSTASTLPPVRELQVPTISQLLQIKKLQSGTERARQITVTQNTPHSMEYTLPVATTETAVGDNCEDGGKPQSVQLQKFHTNKIKHKQSNTMRASSARDSAIDEEAPPPPNLPTIAFPLMTSVPKIDIALPGVRESRASATRHSSDIAAVPSAANDAFSNASACLAANVKFPSFGNIKSNNNNDSNKNNSKKLTNFKFSTPLELQGVSKPKGAVPASNTAAYTFSPPTTMGAPLAASVGTPIMLAKQPQTHQSPAPLKTGSVLDALRQPFALPAYTQTATTSATMTSTTTKTAATSSFGDQFKKCAGEWECDACMLRNKSDAAKCIACETTRKVPAPSAAMTAAEPAPVPAATAHSFFDNKFRKADGDWECDACMLINKGDAQKCVACETPQKGALKAPTEAAAVSFFGDGSSLFVDPFKSQASKSKWECSTCLIQNQLDIAECVACQSSRPGADSGTVKSQTKTRTTAPSDSSFTFGFPAATSTAVAKDVGFKTLAAAQMSAKWECDACMTRNDTSRSKCACCDQAKPGTQSTALTAVDGDTPKFTFGSTAAAKFNFGFGSAGAAPTAVSGESKTEVSDTPKAVGFVFGASDGSTKQKLSADAGSTSAGGFTFGIKPDSGATAASAINTSAITSTDAVELNFGASTPSEFVFGAGSLAPTTTAATNSALTSTSESATATTTATASSAIASPSAHMNLSTTVTAVAPTTIATTAIPAMTPSFNFGSSPKTSATGVTAAATDIPAKPLGGFSFDLTSPKTAATAAPTSGSGFAFKSTATTSIGVVEPMFSFGSATTAAPATATLTTVATSTPAFSFGSGGQSSGPTGATKTLFGTTTSSPNVAATTATTSASTVFGSFGSATTTATTAPSTSMFGTSVLAADNGNNKDNIISSSSTTVTSTPAFGSFGGSTAGSGSSIFGAFGATGSPSALPLSKPAAAATQLFGSSNGGSATATPSFVFGPSAGTASAPAKNSFIFGGASANTSTAAVAPATSDLGGGLGKSSSLFGAAAAQPVPVGASALPAAPLFGNMGTSVAPPAFGSGNGLSAAPIGGGSTAMFGASSTPAVTPMGGNIFGSATAAATSTMAPSAFGSGASLFGASGGGAPTPTAFGNVVAAARPPPPAFGSGFGIDGGSGASGSSNMDSGATTTDGASAAKKSELSFSFGGSTTAAPPQSASGIFNFGAAANAKPAFNFASTTAQPPAFNFTGNAEMQTAQQTMHQQPFQFGATAATHAPVFNFSSGHIETTPNAPFQFGGANGAAAPVPSNIFAPQMTPGGAGGQQQVRRKIRQPIRRMTPR